MIKSDPIFFKHKVVLYLVIQNLVKLKKIFVLHVTRLVHVQYARTVNFPDFWKPNSEPSCTDITYFYSYWMYNWIFQCNGRLFCLLLQIIRLDQIAKHLQLSQLLKNTVRTTYSDDTFGTYPNCKDNINAITAKRSMLYPTFGYSTKFALGITLETIIFLEQNVVLLQ